MSNHITTLLNNMRVAFLCSDIPCFNLSWICHWCCDGCFEHQNLSSCCSHGKPCNCCSSCLPSTNCSCCSNGRSHCCKDSCGCKNCCTLPSCNFGWPFPSCFFLQSQHIGFFSYIFSHLDRVYLVLVRVGGGK